jgi:hypothetical protein
MCDYDGNILWSRVIRHETEDGEKQDASLHPLFYSVQPVQSINTCPFDNLACEQYLIKLETPELNSILKGKNY